MRHPCARPGPVRPLGPPALRWREIRWPWRTGAVIALTCVAAACGKKGPPLVPIVRIPQPVNEITARRVDADVYLRLRVPALNRDGSTPADVARIDLFALTAEAAPSAAAFLRHGTRVASLPVAVAATSQGPPPESAGAPVVTQGGEVFVRDTLGPDALVPVTLPVEAGEARDRTTDGTHAGVESDAAPVRRYYMAFAFSQRDKRSDAGQRVAVAVTPPPPPPADIALTYNPSAAVISWSGVEAGDAYDVYPDDAETPAAHQPVIGARMPSPLNAAPLPATSFSMPYVNGERRCYHVRTRRSDTGGETRESAPSVTRCHTPEDIFEPAPPVDLQALPGVGEITLIWSPNEEPDLAGYLVLRGRAGDDTLAGITASPVTGTRYVDRTVMPGVRYVYAVVAVDTRAPVANRSAPSARDEATAR